MISRRYKEKFRPKAQLIALFVAGGRDISSASGDLSFSIQLFRSYSLFAPHGFPPAMQLAQMQGAIKEKSCGNDLLVGLQCTGLIPAWYCTDGARHIFCLGCADGLGLSHPTADDRRCPACHWAFGHTKAPKRCESTEQCVMPGRSQLSRKSQILPGIPWKEPHRKVCKSQHTDGQGNSQRKLRDLNSAWQSLRYATKNHPSWGDLLLSNCRSQTCKQHKNNSRRRTKSSSICTARN